MNEEEAVRLVRTLAEKNGGKVSFRSFIAEAGIPDQRIRKEPWFPGWNQFIEKIGLETSVFEKERTTDEVVTAALADLIERLKHWPTEDECAREKKRNHAFPDLKVIRRVRKSGKLYELLRIYNPQDAAFALSRRLAEDLNAQHASQKTEQSVADSSRVQGYVYMMRYGGKYKIGFTNSLARRFRDVQIELPEETFKIHTIETDDPSGIEQYWHKRFAAKRIRKSEWFDLNADDVRAFKRRKYQ